MSMSTQTFRFKHIAEININMVLKKKHIVVGDLSVN